MEEIKLVVCDIDGTLRYKSEQLPVLNKKVINALHKHGVMVGIASGRSLQLQVVNQWKKWGLDQPFDLSIGMNGSQMWDEVNQERIDSYKLSEESMKEILTILVDKFGMNPTIYTEEGTMAYPEDNRTEEIKKRNTGMTFKLAKNIDEMTKGGNAKIMCRGEVDELDKIQEYFNKKRNTSYKAFRTGDTMLEFTDKHVSKAIAVERFCKEHHIDMENVLAFGDQENDIEMLKAAGIGVCLKNGGETTKAISDYITEKNCEDSGFGHFMIKHVFKPLGWNC